jgi:hypothetical protein
MQMPRLRVCNIVTPTSKPVSNPVRYCCCRPNSSFNNHNAGMKVQDALA